MFYLIIIPIFAGTPFESTKIPDTGSGYHVSYDEGDDDNFEINDNSSDTVNNEVQSSSSGGRYPVLTILSQQFEFRIFEKSEKI